MKPIIENPAKRLRHSSKNPRALGQNPNHNFAHNHALLHMPTGAIYSFIPKNACSTFRFSFAVANGCADIGGSVDWIHANNMTFRASLRELVTTPYCFVILRCPFQRLASVYLDKIVNGFPVGWSLYHPVRTGADNPQKLSFHDFIHRVCKPVTLRANIHWRPQADFLLYKEYDDVFSLKKLKIAEQVLKEKIGLDLIDTRAELKHDRSNLEKEAGNFSKTQALDLAIMRRNGKAPTTESLYTDDLIALVKQQFAQDIELYTDWTDQKPTF